MTTRLQSPHSSTIQGARECDSVSPTSTAARAAAASLARCLARRARHVMFVCDNAHGASFALACHASATAFGRQTDNTASSEAAMAHLAADPCTI